MEPEDEGDICLVESETESAAKVVSTLLEAEPIDAAPVLILRPVLELRGATLEAEMVNLSPRQMTLEWVPAQRKVFHARLTTLVGS